MKSTCVQCHNQMDYSLEDNILDGNIRVCARPECPNYGLLAITQEKMPKPNIK